MWVLLLDFGPCFNYSRGCGLCLSLSCWLLRALLLWGLFNCYVLAKRETERGNVLYSSWPPTMLQSWRPGVICLFSAERRTVKYSAPQTMHSFFQWWMAIFFHRSFFSLSVQQIDLCDIIYYDQLPELLQFQAVKRSRDLLKSQHLRYKSFWQSLHLIFIIRLVAGIC